MTVLPLFTSTGMRDAERVGSVTALLCPRQKLLPWQIQRSTLAASFLTELNLVDCDGNETNIFNDVFSGQTLLTGWTNSGYNVFNTAVGLILTAIETDSAEVWGYSNEFALSTGDAVRLDYNLTLNSGDLPSFYLGKSDGTKYSAPTLAATGQNTIFLTATGSDSGDLRLLIQNEAGDDTNYQCLFSLLAFNTLEIDQFSTYDFITYNGTPLSDELPYGVYYLKTSDGNSIWYSEWFTVKDLQPNLVTSLTNSSYDTFVSSGIDIVSAVNAAGDAVAWSNTFSVRAGELLIITYDTRTTSGQNARLSILDNTDTALENIIVGDLNFGTSDGIHEIGSVGAVNIVKISKTTTGARLKFSNSAASTFAMSSISVRRKAGDYIHLEFTNDRDFNNGDESILYQDGFRQQAYLDTYLNDPRHEPTEIGDEPNGVFIAEKLISKFLYNIVTYESRSMFNALRLLPHHNTIKILDEVGNEYTPDQGNVRVSKDPDTFDTATIRIEFNETADVWTSNMDNIV